MAGRVGIAGYGTTPFTMEDIQVEVLLQQSAGDLFVNNPGIDRGDVDAVLVSTNSNSKYLAPILAETMGIRPRTAHSVENLCNSGTNSIVSGYAYIASGLAETVLVSGAERHDSPDGFWNGTVPGGEFKHPIFWGSILTRAYKRRFAVSDEDLAVVPVKNHRQARGNPEALSKRTYTREEVAASRRLTDDLRMLDCSRPCSGGASILLASEEAMRGICDAPVWIRGLDKRPRRQDSEGIPRLTPWNRQGMQHITPWRWQAATYKISTWQRCMTHSPSANPWHWNPRGLAKKGAGLGMIQEAYDTGSFTVNPRGGLIGAGIRWEPPG